MSEPETDLPRGQLFEEAAAWFARMRGPDAEASRSEFEAWLARGALHRSAYNRASEIFTMAKLLEDRQAEGPPAKPPVRKRALLAGTVAAVCLVFGAGLVGLYRTGELRKDNWTLAEQQAIQLEPEEIATQAREGAAYRLNDGSLVSLSAATRLKVDITPQVRRLVLEAGEARFKVAHESRPFIVYAGGGSVTARGTVFDVALAADRSVRVHLIEGVIDVAPPGRAEALRPQRLVAGQSTRFAIDPAPGAALQPPSPDTRAQGMQGVQDYDGVRISDLVEEANRLSQRPIRVSRALGDRRVSGHFRIDNTDVLADRIAGLFDMTVDRSDPSVILLKAR